MRTITAQEVKKMYPPRPVQSRKYDHGLMLVIGGSEYYTGAPAIAAFAGFRAGLDMVRILAPKRAADIIASFSPVLAAYGLDGSHIEKKDVSFLISRTMAAKEIARGNVSILIGNGLGRDEETQEAIKEYLAAIDLPCVIDADAIYAVAERPEIIVGKPFVFTPHSYEFFELTGKNVHGLPQEEKIELVKQEAARLQTTLLLKSHIDIVSNGSEVILSKTGTPYMTVGGAGDSLAGILGALLARGIAPLEAAAAAAYINGKAGELATKKFKDGLIATDIIEEIPHIIS
ncbi:MAG: NAD(P)H-hydrate dehydratase [Candidatus Wildermuthbacteria bacterium RIFCSPLOWO2_02_FULL_47_9c]|uniref:ADP-dependent (S)-NAD(P)H-hydrate dehydratase n=2 Tax=Parcubacteria group TaxID=1794811 RepID=A0A1G2RTE4_9BACT|nr:MAG: putative sugar kinase, YjeF-related protein [Parcubacteria group bacterium GW2011_GWB1_49_12]KKW14366.1 MAG: putative sugar kinase, YjeF-related protein [Parcubacteria group bacterium GW2011_GWA2_50_10]OHA61207.1 MAG: NAD(P)H-hydrate dehydratase [Candidatus Wildermuthbacteria bacterium GWA1_49_26]OHA65676.1 MAG: NAD(P)H-hydrate dehydratase [Candidatus Wildermuthbacteria bacterium RIFCSPHIGHO2_01_FULL_50_47]OHA69398.1 MAG: NAD(P)H-hydrate dehydratase [Candidatus Wildermuthbacteria bacter